MVNFLKHIFKNDPNQEATMVQAKWNGKVVAQSDRTIVVEGNHYFPPDAINEEFFQESSRHTICPWKGSASYYDLKVEGKVNPAAAWYYPHPKAAAREIEVYIAFWNGVEVRKVQ
jgi:uncharacterized protein (DUF427 family)